MGREAGWGTVGTCGEAKSVSHHGLAGDDSETAHQHEHRNNYDCRGGGCNHNCCDGLVSTGGSNAGASRFCSPTGSLKCLLRYCKLKSLP